MSRALRPLLFVAVLTGCARRDVVPVPLDGLGDGWAFLVFRTADGSVSRRSPVFAIADGLGLEPRDDEVEVVAVGLPEPRLRALVPSFEPSRGRELQVEPGPACAGDGAALETAGLVEVALPSDLPTRVGPLGGAAPAPAAGLLDGLRLRVPSSFARCPGEVARLAPIGDDTTPLAPTPPIGGQVQDDWDHRVGLGVAAIDADRAVVVTRRSLHLVERGRAPIDAPDHARAVESLPGVELADVAWDADRQRLWLVGIADEEGHGAVWSMGVDAAGLGAVELSTRSLGRLDAVLIQPDGGLVAVGAAGQIVSRASDAAPWRATTRPGPLDEHFAVAWTGEPESPVLVGSLHATVLEGAAAPGSWSAATLVDAGDQLFTVVTVAAASEAPGRPRWAGGLGGLYERRAGGPWRPSTLALPPDVFACAAPADACGRRGPGTTVVALAPVVGASGADWLVVSAAGCTAPLVVRVADGCVGWLGRDDEPRARRTEIGERVTAMAAAPGRVLMVGEAGQLVEARLP